MTSEAMLISPGSKIVNIDLEKFRKLIRNYIDKHQYLAAEFWADKLVSLSGGAYIDVYYLAQCYYLSRQFHRAVLLITSYNLTRNATCRYLAAKCFYEVGEFQRALEILDNVKSTNSILRKSDVSPIVIPEIDDAKSTECSVHLLKGYIHEASDNRTLAMESFRTAFRIDPLCYEAFHALTQHHMLSLDEEKSLLSSLLVSDSCSEEEAAFVQVVYETRLNKYSGVKPKLSVTPALETNLDFQTSEAENLYYHCDFANCFKLTQRILQKDPYHPNCLPIHISCLVELKQANSLFLMGHKMVDLYPENALSWYAVGCYYYLIGKNDHARRFLSKATALDRVFGPAWIAYGHSFAAENEHDQARAAYYKAAQLIKGCHLPLLYIGMEYSLTNNPKFAEMFFKQALEIAPEDPFVHHELGVVAYTSQDYLTAEGYFRRAVSVVEDNSLTVIPDKWATLLQNLGHTLCKLGRFEEALQFHQYALRVCSGTASAYAAIGLVQTHLGNYQEAIVSLHKSLSLQKDHTVAASLLSSLMNQVVVHSPVFEGDDSVLAFDMIAVESSTSKSNPSSQTVPSISSMDDIKSILGSSIGKPVMQSSDVANETANPSTPQRPGGANDSTVMLIEDMVMDDDSP